MEKSCPILTVLSAILMATDQICIDFSANSAPISVECSDLGYTSGVLMDVLWRICRYLDQN